MFSLQLALAGGLSKALQLSCRLGWCQSVGQCSAFQPCTVVNEQPNNSLILKSSDCDSVSGVSGLGESTDVNPGESTSVDSPGLCIDNSAR